MVVKGIKDRNIPVAIPLTIIPLTENCPTGEGAGPEQARAHVPPHSEHGHFGLYLDRAARSILIEMSRSAVQPTPAPEPPVSGALAALWARLLWAVERHV
jgi:hypothetical protein